MFNAKYLILTIPPVFMGCDRGGRLYTDAITDQFGNAVKTNIVSQATDMIPPKSMDKKIVTDANKTLPPRAERVQDDIGDAQSGGQGGGQADE